MSKMFARYLSEYKITYVILSSLKFLSYLVSINFISKLLARRLMCVIVISYIKFFLSHSGVMTCTCSPGTLEAEFWNGVSWIPFGGNSPLIGGWIVWPPVIQHKEKSRTKYWDLTET